jgi:ribosomal protein S18 acetylase RimI-like enzyme
VKDRASPTLRKHVLPAAVHDLCPSCPNASAHDRHGRLCNRVAVPVHVDDSQQGIDWEAVKADLAADEFDNGRSARALRRSFDQSQFVAFARDGERVVGTARLLSDGVCNAYLLDVWTASAYRRQGIASAMVRLLLERVPGQHVGLQTSDAASLYASLGFRAQPEFWSIVVGAWLENDANR